MRNDWHRGHFEGRAPIATHRGRGWMMARWHDGVEEVAVPSAKVSLQNGKIDEWRTYPASSCDGGLIWEKNASASAQAFRINVDGLTRGLPPFFATIAPRVRGGYCRRIRIDLLSRRETGPSSASGVAARVNKSLSCSLHAGRTTKWYWPTSWWRLSPGDRQCNIIPTYRERLVNVMKTELSLCYPH